MAAILKDIESWLRGLAKDGNTFYITGGRAYLKILDEFMLKYALPVLDERHTLSKYLKTSNLNITYVSGSKNYNQFITTIADGTQLYAKGEGLLPVGYEFKTIEKKSSELKSKEENRFLAFQIAKSSVNNNIDRVIFRSTQLYPKGEGLLPEDKRTFSITIVDASFEGSISRISELDLYKDANDGLNYIGLSTILSKFVMLFRSPTFLKKEKNYFRMIIILNFALRGYLNTSYYDSFQFEGVTDNKLKLNQLIKLNDSIRLSINKLRTVAPQYHNGHFTIKLHRSLDRDSTDSVDLPDSTGLTFISGFQSTVIQPNESLVMPNPNQTFVPVVYNDVNKMGSLDKIFMCYKKHIFDIPTLEQAILDRTASSSGVDIDEIIADDADGVNDKE